MTQEPIPYTIRESVRAKRVTLKITPGKGLEVVIPAFFPQNRIPGIVESKRAWIEKALAKLKPRENAGELRPPKEIHLRAMDSTWRVESIVEGARFSERNGVLRLPLDAWPLRLGHWLQEKAKDHLDPLAHKLAADFGLFPAGITIRNQKTRWGSCTSRSTLSLNRKLMFMEPRLVRYVIMHELAHLRHQNHSREFWTFLASMDGECRRHRAELKTADTDIPAWALL
ncbi:MAG: SprT family zinc-dependent metalloprotease [Synergistota bacterium]|nr:SprT family zinc-dependent metalloprotease [Synergistota bacterium]